MLLHDFLDHYAREQPANEFAVQGDRCLSYAQAREEANRLANALSASGLKAGDRLAVLSKNSIEYMLTYFAASKVGVVTVPINFRLSPTEWTYIVNDAGARVMLVSADFVPAVEAARDQLPVVERFVAVDGPAPTGWVSYEEWLRPQSTTSPVYRIDPSDALYQMYTSGTTSAPKGVVISQRALFEQLVQVAAMFQPRRGERFLLVAPLFHSAATSPAFTFVSRGGRLLVHSEFMPQKVVQALSEEGVAAVTMVPAMVQACLNLVPDATERSYPALRIMAYGGSAVSPATARRAAETFKCGLVQAYGMTETASAASFLSPDDHCRGLADRPELLLSAGLPVLGTEIRVVDDAGTPVGCGTLGEVAIRGPQLMDGYWNLPAATALRDGWMHTGDLGYLDHDGYLYIRDRVADRIISGGENISPRTVEEALLEHPAVADASAIGVPDSQWGEVVKAIVVPRSESSVTEAGLIAHCRARLAGYECPRSVDFTDVLPRNAAGKVLKRELREPYWAGQERRVGVV